MKELKGICGEAYFEFFTDENPAECMEFQSTHDISIELGTNAANRISVDLSGFKNAVGQSVVDVILESWDKIAAIVAEQDRIEIEEAAKSYAELEEMDR